MSSISTIKDVAARAGVAPSTVSKYINGGSVREKNVIAIREAIAELEFRANPFARNLKSQRSHAIGVLLPDLSAPFFSAMLEALNRVIRARGYHSLISCYSSNHGLERDNLRFLLEASIDGLIYVPEDLSAEEFHELTDECGVPVVLADRMIPGSDKDTVLTNNTESVYKATSHLISEGHRRIGIISGPKSVFTAKERLVGYLRALSDNGIIYDDSLVISGDNIFATGYQGLISMMSLNTPPTAIFSTNYNITLGLITSARERGIVIPDHVSVFGYDSVDVCRMMTPALPVVFQPEQEIGRLAAEYLIERLDGSTVPPRMTVLESKLVI